MDCIRYCRSFSSGFNNFCYSVGSKVTIRLNRRIPFLFNLFINDLLLFLSNYAGNNNRFSIRKDITKVKDTLAKDSGIVTNWLYENFMVFNSKKCHFVRISTNGTNETFTFKNVCYKNSKEEVILAITIDNKFSFDSHIRKLCKKSSQELNALKNIMSK